MNKQAHLTMIEEVISRLSNLGSKFKEFALAIASICSTIIGVSQINKNLLWILLLPIVVCWFLNGNYLSVERKYANLYEKVRNLSEDRIDFSMKVKGCSDIEDKRTKLFHCLISWSVGLYYLILIGMVIGVYFVI